MDLIRNVRPYKNRSIQGEVFFGLFDRYIAFRTADSVPMAYIHSCAALLNSLSDRLIEHLCQASIRYRNDFISAVGETAKTVDNHREILSHITPQTLLIPEPGNGSEPVLHMELDCQWEEEHGLEWIARGEQALYVGGLGSNNPWHDYSERKSWNYA